MKQYYVVSKRRGQNILDVFTAEYDREADKFIKQELVHSEELTEDGETLQSRDQGRVYTSQGRKRVYSTESLSRLHAVKAVNPNAKHSKWHGGSVYYAV